MNREACFTGIGLLALLVVCSSFNQATKSKGDVTFSAQVISVKEDSVKWGIGVYTQVHIHTCIKNNTGKAVVCYLRHTCNNFDAGILYEYSNTGLLFQATCMGQGFKEHTIPPFGTIEENTTLGGAYLLAGFINRKFTMGVKLVSRDMVHNVIIPKMPGANDFSKAQYVMNTTQNILWSDTLVIK